MNKDILVNLNYPEEPIGQDVEINDDRSASEKGKSWTGKVQRSCRRKFVSFAAINQDVHVSLNYLDDVTDKIKDPESVWGMK